MSYRENIEEIKIPKYTKGQEVFNTISHVLGIPLAFIILFVGLYRLLVRAISITEFLGLLVFVITIVDVYFVSSLYHGTEPNIFNNEVKAVIDIDAPIFNRFNENDQKLLEELASVLAPLFK